MRGWERKKKTPTNILTKYYKESYARAHASRAKKKVLRSLESECSAGALLTERLQAGEKPPHPPLAFEIEISTLEWLQIVLGWLGSGLAYPKDMKTIVGVFGVICCGLQKHCNVIYFVPSK